MYYSPIDEQCLLHALHALRGSKYAILNFLRSCSSVLSSWSSWKKDVQGRRFCHRRHWTGKINDDRGHVPFCTWKMKKQDFTFYKNRLHAMNFPSVRWKATPLGADFEDGKSKTALCAVKRDLGLKTSFLSERRFNYICFSINIYRLWRLRTSE